MKSINNTTGEHQGPQAWPEEMLTKKWVSSILRLMKSLLARKKYVPFRAEPPRTGLYREYLLLAGHWEHFKNLHRMYVNSQWRSESNWKGKIACRWMISFCIHLSPPLGHESCESYIWSSSPCISKPATINFYFLSNFNHVFVSFSLVLMFLPLVKCLGVSSTVYWKKTFLTLKMSF